MAPCVCDISDDHFNLRNLSFKILTIVFSELLNLQEKKIKNMKVRLDGCQNSRDIIDGAPLVLQNVQTDLSVCVNVRVEHSDQKFDL